MTTGLVVALLVIGFIAYLVYESKRANDAKADMLDASRKIPGFSPHFFVADAEAKHCLVVDEQLNFICWLTHGQQVQHKLLRADQVFSVEIIEDGNTVVKTSRSGQLGGMAVGGLLLGGVGAVVGGLSATQTHRSKVSSLKLRIIVDDPKTPQWCMPFLTLESDRQGTLYRAARSNADEWHARIRVMVERAERTQTTPPLPPMEKVEFDPVAKLERLAALHASGAITEAEFATAKAQILLPRRPKLPSGDF